MEPSLRSSSYRASECKLKKTETSLHETVQRFVESLSDDTRISQYADINYAIKKFESRKWYWLNPSGRSGYLVCLPKMPIIWIDEQFKFSYKIRMRLSSHIYEKVSVFIASLNMGDSILRLEDVWLLSGNNVRQTPFTQRWNSLLEFFSVSYKQDTILQQGLQLELATYEPLSVIKDMTNLPNMMFAQGENDRKRLRVQLTPVETTKVIQEPAKVIQEPTKLPKEGTKVTKEGTKVTREVTKLPKEVTKVTKEPTPKIQQNEAIAVAHPEYPDTYDLLIDGVKKGYAAVQDIELSKRLKACITEIRVKIGWNPEFSMYEIHDIL